MGEWMGRGCSEVVDTGWKPVIRVEGWSSCALLSEGAEWPLLVVPLYLLGRCAEKCAGAQRVLGEWGLGCGAGGKNFSFGDFGI